jgi:DNA repair exonuclease SbcCD ATPase subunit
VRLRPFLVISLCSLGAIVHATGAPGQLRDQVETLLADPAITATSPEVNAAKAQAKANLAQADATRSKTLDDATVVADVLDETALEWAQLSKELVELATLQTQADKAEQRQVDLESQLKREKAHLEETEARRGRALAALKKLGENTDLQTSPAPTSEAKGAVQ